MTPRKKAPAPKPVKAWAILSPSGRAIALAIQKAQAWHDAGEEVWDCPHGGCDPDDSQSCLKAQGYRAIQVTISPLKR